MMNALASLAVGAAAGYAVGRYLEGQAQGLPVAVTFDLNTITVPVATLRARVASAPVSAPTAEALAAAAVSPLFPFGMGGVGRRRRR